MAGRKKSGRLARRYAKALLVSVQRELGLEGRPTPSQVVAAKLKDFADAWSANEQFQQYCLSPMFPREARLGAFMAVAAKAELSEVARRFLTVLFTRERTAALPEVSAAFSVIADEAAGVIQVEILTARAVADDERGEIEQGLRAKIAGELTFHWDTDAELIGGMIIRYSGRVVDGSIKGRLERMEEILGVSAA